MTRPWDERISRRHALGIGLAGAAALGLATTGCSTAEPSSRSANTTTPTIDEGKPIRGGTLKIGLIGGGPADSLDPHSLISPVDVLRTYCLYDSLARLTPQRTVVPALAEELTPSKGGQVWTIVLRDGVTFHDDKPVTADDVVFSLQRIIDPKAPKNGAIGFADISTGGLRALDERTVRVTLDRPNYLFLDWCAEYTNAIVPRGFDPKGPIGSGPFQKGSFTPGERSVFSRYPDYWRDDLPYVDELVVIEFNDDTAVVNAVVSGAVDVIYGAPSSQRASLGSNPDLTTTVRRSGSFFPLTMRVDTGPFRDVRVRQAMRLLTDRKQLLDQVLSGDGRIANDLYAPLDPCYAESLLQRRHDPDQARALLKKAGQSDLSLQLVTSPLVTGLVESAQVYKQQAAAAGVSVTVKQVEPIQFFTQSYLQSPFSQDIWDERSFISQTIASFTPGSPFNATHWDDPEFTSLLADARGEPNGDKRCGIEADLQAILHDRGGYIIWAFPNDVTVSRPRVKGLAGTEAAVPPAELWLT